MPDLRRGQQVRLTNPVYPDFNEVGALEDSTAPRVGAYGTHTIRRADGSRFRSEGVLHAA